MATGAIEVLGVLSSLAGSLFKFDAAEKQRQVIKEEETQEKLAADQQTIQRQNQLQSIIGAQQASFGARGLAASSISFRAVSQDSFNQFAQDQRLANIESSLRLKRLKDERKNIQTDALFEAGKDVATTAFNLFSERERGQGGAPGAGTGSLLDPNNESEL